MAPALLLNQRSNCRQGLVEVVAIPVEIEVALGLAGEMESAHADLACLREPGAKDRCSPWPDGSSA